MATPLKPTNTLGCTFSPTQTRANLRTGKDRHFTHFCFLDPLDSVGTCTPSKHPIEPHPTIPTQNQLNATTERTKDWVRLVPWAVLSMNSQRSFSTGFTPHELFHGGRPAWFFKTPFPEDFKSPVGDWLEHKQSLANQAGISFQLIFWCDQTTINAIGLPYWFQ